ncbi:agamous-like MADS-box protein AGL61 [Telopea speciosissima]|uniref:agamous-like MADS-box protein AGL61 n=1 Tax=Telopea speciosissima TaxID=54955 RepID=UPI001CC74D3E|nr:agamous-like MADS-box protein AGL61 [Telopea speciosissima]
MNQLGHLKQFRSSVPRKRSMGRRKIEMKTIDKEPARLVTFAKRRVGLFNKANELSTLCGAEVVILLFSESGKVYSFGHPNVNSILDKFLVQNFLPEENVPKIMEESVQGTKNSQVVKHEIMTELLSKVGVEKKRGKALDQQREEETLLGGEWWQGPIEDLDLPKLNHLMLSIHGFIELAMAKANMLTLGTKNGCK